MKSLLRNYLINLASLWATTRLVQGLTFEGGLKTLAIGALGLMILNVAVIPLLRVMFLPLNLLTLGLFAWVVNVVALYLLVTFIPQFKLEPYLFPGFNLSGVQVPQMQLNVLQVAILASFLVGLFSQLLKWLVSK